VRIPAAGLVLSLLLLGSFCAAAQDGPKGHWRGGVELPDRTLDMEVDLDKPAAAWIGSLSVPAQNATGIPLADIAFTEGKVTFRMAGGANAPAFSGTLSEDGKTMSGDFSQGGASFPFKFTRAGEPKVDVPKPSPAVAKELLGSWEGALEAAGQTLHLILKVENRDDGAHATLTSVDQGGVEIPVTSISQKDAKVTLEVKNVGGHFEGDLKNATELDGTWSQNGNDMPLKLKKAGSAPKG
jgi:hypothetical protein